MASLNPGRKSNIYATARPRKLRTRSGCHACRARRKKCGEQKPVCEACQRLHLVCWWPPSPSEDSMDINTISAPDPQPSEPSRAFSATKHESMKCSGRLLADAELEILYSPQEVLIAELRELSQNLHESGFLPSRAYADSTVRGQLLLSEGPEAVTLFDHFCHRTAPWLINGRCDDNPVLRHILPLTSTDELVLHTVLAVSGAHLQHTAPSIGPAATKYYSRALQSLKRRISDWMESSSKDYKPLSATIILLCHCEVSIHHANTLHDALTCSPVCTR